jgi:hypothetical protein
MVCGARSALTAPDGHRPQLQVRAELGPLGGCPRPLPRATTLAPMTLGNMRELGFDHP